MKMTSKKEFLNVLNHHLQGIPDDEINDVLYDYEEYFNAGVLDGRSEAELTNALGDPKAIAKQVRAVYMVQLAKDTPSIRNLYNAVLAAIGLGFFKVIGLTLIAAGLLISINEVGIINLSWRYIWPIFVLCPGLACEFSYFTNPMKNKINLSLLIPGGILTTTGLLFFYNAFTNFQYMDKLWPIFILSVAIGLFQFYYGKRIDWLLIPIVILTIVGVVFLVSNLASKQIFGIFLGVFLIVIGLLVGFNVGKKKSHFK